MQVVGDFTIFSHFRQRNRLKPSHPPSERGASAQWLFDLPPRNFSSSNRVHKEVSFPSTGFHQGSRFLAEACGDFKGLLNARLAVGKQEDDCCRP